MLKWVNYLQELKQSGELPADVWVTSSDNYAAWGGSDDIYRTDDLAALVKAVDYVSLHTYPFHDTYHTPKFWIAPAEEKDLSELDKASAAVGRALGHAKSQYQSTANYIKSLGVEKAIHIGETGWASSDSAHYGAKGSQAAGEFNAGLFYDAMRDWTQQNGIACFYFEAFDEQWKDMGDAAGSENHFGLISLAGEAKYALWDELDAGKFKGLKRGGNEITKTQGGDADAVKGAVLAIPSSDNLGGLAISTMNEQRNVGEPVSENRYVMLNDSLVPSAGNDMTYPSQLLKLNIWEGTCGMELSGKVCLLYTSPSPRDKRQSRMPSSA